MNEDRYVWFGFLVVVGFMLIIYPFEIFGPFAGQWYILGVILSFIGAWFLRIHPTITMIVTFGFCMVQGFMSEPIGDSDPLGHEYYTTVVKTDGIDGSDEYDRNIFSSFYSLKRANYLWMKKREHHPRMIELLKENNMTFEELLLIGEGNSRRYHYNKHHSDFYYDPNYVDDEPLRGTPWDPNWNKQ